MQDKIGGRGLCGKRRGRRSVSGRGRANRRRRGGGVNRRRAQSRAPGHKNREEKKQRGKTKKTGQGFGFSGRLSAEQVLFETSEFPENSCQTSLSGGRKRRQEKRGGRAGLPCVVCPALNLPGSKKDAEKSGRLRFGCSRGSGKSRDSSADGNRKL